VLADESLIGRAVANLVGNAADACLMAHPRPGQVKVTVVDTPGNLLIEITDSGVGMSDQTLSDLMVNDFKSTKRNSGVGLGLGVARHVASAHGGTITATSIEGEGSTFVLRIPRQTTVSPFTGSETHGRVHA
jgi:two-component system sensor histidine kinase BaeS